VDDFVGRGFELGAIRRAIEGMRAKRGGLLVVAGEPGIGKTRLAEEACGLAGSAGARIAWGRCVELEGAPAYWPWIQVLRSLASETGPANVDVIDGPALEISSFLRGSGAATGDAGRRRRRETEDRFRLFDDVTQRLRAASSDAGLVVVLDDLQWSDRPSLGLLRHLSRHLREMALLVIATYRDVELAGDHPLVPLLPELVRERGAVRLKLTGLSAEEVGRCLLATCGPEIDAGLSATVHDCTAGNPFFVSELARLFAREGRSGALPEGVADVITRRLETLSHPCRDALGAAAVLGREFDLTLLSEVAAVSLRELLGRMDEAARLGVLAGSAVAGDRYSFVHDLFRETVYRSLSASVRVRMHRLAAERIEARAGVADLAVLAHHWFQAAAVSGWERAVVSSSRAARRAAEQLAYEEAARLYSQALTAQRRLPPDEGRQCEMLLELADAQYHSGDLALSLESCVEAAASASSLGRVDLLARAALVLKGVSDRELAPTMRRLCEDALVAVGHSDPALRARLLGQLAELLEDSPGASERRDALSREALALAEQAADEIAVVAALHARHAATTGPDHVEERLAIGTCLVELGSRSDWTVQALWGRLWRIDSLFQLGDLASVPIELTELQEIVRRLHQPFFRWHLVRSQAALAYVTGRFDEALQLAEEAFAVGRSEQHSTTEIVYRGTRAWLAFDVGGSAPLEDYLAMTARGPRYDLPVTNAGALNMELALGRKAAAKDRFDRVISAYPRWEKDGRWLMVTSLLAEPAIALGSQDQVLMLYEALRPYSRLFAVSGAGAASCRGAVARQVGELAAALGRSEEAERYLSEAILLNRKAGAAPFTAYSQFSQARLLAERAANARAMAQARATLDAASRLGMRPLRERSANLVAQLERAAPKLSARETEVAQLLATGLSNREIGTALHVSERTAESHVRHIMDKLGFKSRSQIAAWAAEEGLTADTDVGSWPQ
jgi:DNA-binding CsgD family transcriptional regulator